MSTLKSVIITFVILLFCACNNKTTKKETLTEKAPITTSKEVSLSPSETILKATIAAHGGPLFDSANYAFSFRGVNYQFKNNGLDYKYTKSYQKEGKQITDVLKNGTFFRTINDSAVTLSKKDINSATGAINSVIYFATLPYKLNDKAVNTKFIETTTIKNKSYDVIEVTFDEAGGGEDHDDVFNYWINKNTKKIDYLAYSYKVNKGGVRFRSAFNTRIIDGITFQDYVNYEAKVGTPLKDLPKLYEAGELKELSTIKTENIINLNNN